MMIARLFFMELLIKGVALVFSGIQLIYLNNYSFSLMMGYLLMEAY